MRLAMAVTLLAWALAVAAQPWAFDAPLPVTKPEATPVFHHLESAGRRNIAVSNATVGVVWEDNRVGVPAVYAAFKPLGANGFTVEHRVSDVGEAYEPAIAPVADKGFVVAWEEGGRVWVRRVDTRGLGAAVQVSATKAGQATLGTHRGVTYVAWAEQEGRFHRVRVARLRVTEAGLQAEPGRAVDATPLQDEQLYPALAVTDEAAAVAWEDRRFGHTRLFYSQAARGGTFAPYQQLNETSSRRLPYGRGSGVARVALARVGGAGVAAVWSDKRDFLSGYDVYAALSSDGGRSFGPNQKVQDEFGNAITQWHPSIAAHESGTVVVAWDDDRDNTSDIWLSWKTAGGWSDDFAVPGASGPGSQTHSAITLDGEGNLHLAWVARDAEDGPTRISYVLGRRAR